MKENNKKIQPKDFQKSYLFYQDDFFKGSISEFLTNEIISHIELHPLKQSEVFIILEESITNAFIHGLWQLSIEHRLLDKQSMIEVVNERKEESDKSRNMSFIKVDISFSMKDFVLKISIKDTGSGFDFEHFMKTNFTITDFFDTRGLGLTMIKTYSENVSFSENGSQINISVSPYKKCLI